MATPNFAFPADFEKSPSGSVIVSFPDLPEALTEGADVAEAVARASVCLEEAIAARMVRREDIPKPSRNSAGKVIVMLPAATASKAAHYVAMREAGNSNDTRDRRPETELGPVVTDAPKPRTAGKIRKAPARQTLVRKTALKRKTPLKRNTPLKRKTALRRTPFRGKTK